MAHIRVPAALHAPYCLFARDPYVIMSQLCRTGKSARCLPQEREVNIGRCSKLADVMQRGFKAHLVSNGLPEGDCFAQGNFLSGHPRGNPLYPMLSMIWSWLTMQAPTSHKHNRLLQFVITVFVCKQANRRLLHSLISAICACITCLFGSFERCALRKATDMK